MRDAAGVQKSHGAGLVTRRTAAMAGLLLLALPGAAWAQQNRGADTGARTVQGVVTDAEGNPVDGAAVQLKDTKTLQIRSFITQNGGQYHFSALSPNVDYELSARYRDSTSKTHNLSVFSGGKNAVVNLKLRR